MVSSGSVITDDDINAFINSLNTQATNRSCGTCNVGATVSPGDVITSAKMKGILTAYANFNSAAGHCYCQAGGGGIATHNGGANLAFSAVSGDFDPGDKITAASINNIISDAAAIAAQTAVCNCNSNTAGCLQCTCNGSNCTCNQYCDCNNVCYCYYACTCNMNCTCNLVCSCNGGYCNCNKQCTCNKYLSTCWCNLTNCGCQNVCGCNNVCNCNYVQTMGGLYTCYCNNVSVYTCTCNTNCSCNTQCSCEYGG